jgi:DNA-binding SARP family transcriptional activator
MDGGFRYEPTSTRGVRVVARPRLTRILRARFEHRLTQITAAAGYGKSTALSLAVEDNRRKPTGRDLWLGADPLDARPDRFVAGLAAATGAEAEPATARNLARVVDAIWAQAPTEVALIVDDVHVLGPEGASVLEELLSRLPDNGHLVLAGRRQPALRTARLRAHSQLLELTEADLALDDGELADLVSARADTSTPGADLPRLVALADLQLRAGPGPSAAYLWEEVLASLPEQRRAVLLRAAVLDVLDDEVVAALSDGSLTAVTLIEGLPLVDATESGAFRMHDLMKEALIARLGEADRLAAAQTAADVEEARGNPHRSAAVLARAGDVAGALGAIRRYLTTPTLQRTLPRLVTMRSLAEQLAPASVLAQMLEAEAHWGELSTATDHREVLSEISAVAEAAREAGDAAIEATALFRLCQGHFLEGPSVPAAAVERLASLAEHVPYAAQVLRHVRSEQAMHAGDPDTSAALLHEGPVAYPELDELMNAGQMCSLGRIEDVAATLPAERVPALPAGGSLYSGLALWLRGEASPELALALGVPMAEATRARRVVHPTVSIYGVVGMIALAAGDTETARRLTVDARQVQQWGCAPLIAAFTDLVEAGTALLDDGDEAAAARLAVMLGRVPVGRWPTRAYLLALPLIYTLSPGDRAVLDGCRFGPALATALGAARALVALREQGRLDPIADVAWDRPDLLRAHVLPPHLAELAAAGAAAGTPGADTVLQQLPRLGDWLRRIVQARRLPDTVLAPATERLRRLPAPPGHTLVIGALGPLEVYRDGELITAPDLVRRRRVQELLGYLLEDRSVPRAAAATALWPEAEDDAKASANLRVTLSYLVRSLEPGRGDAAPSFVVADSETIRLAAEVEVDADAFEREMDTALELDRRAEVGAALDRYRQALARYRGPYLAGVRHEWVQARRERLAFLALTGSRRVGELMLAAGDRAAAQEWARWALRVDPDDARAKRLHEAAR